MNQSNNSAAQADQNNADQSDATVRGADAAAPSSTAMKPQTAAKKLGIHLPACPPEFQNGGISHAQLRSLQHEPPQWLQQLRLEGPHPRAEVARKLGISVNAVKTHLDKALTTAEIKELLQNQPEWLSKARTQLAESRKEGARADGDNAADELSHPHGGQLPRQGGELPHALGG